MAGRGRLGRFRRSADRSVGGADVVRSADLVVTVVIAVAAVVLLLAIGFIAYTRRPRQDAGLTSFRRHIDALSPESRREVMDRVRPTHRNDERADDDSQEQTD